MPDPKKKKKQQIPECNEGAEAARRFLHAMQKLVGADTQKTPQLASKPQ